MNGKTYFGILTDDVVKVLALGEFPVHYPSEYERFLTAIGYDRTLARLEYPSIDIELEIYTADGNEPDAATLSDNSIAPSYVVCIKGLYNGRATWITDDFAGDCYVDFSEPNWKEALTQEMEDVLAKYVADHGYSYTDYNF